MDTEEPTTKNSLMGLLSIIDGDQWALFISLWLIFVAANIIFHILLETGDPYAWMIVKSVLNAMRPTSSSIPYDAASLAA
jgi:hypothetical protein